MNRDPLYIFIDDTSLADGSGFVQAAVPILKSSYVEHVAPAARRLLGSSKEFKASKIKFNNVSRYAGFVDTWKPYSAALRTPHGIGPVVTAGPADAYKEENLAEVRSFLANVVNTTLGVRGQDVDSVLLEFTRVAAWLSQHGGAIVPKPIPNGVVVVVDERYRQAASSDAARLLYNPRFGIREGTLSEALRTAANMLLPECGSGSILSEVIAFRFVESTKSFGVQAADLLANLTYARIRHQLGATSPSIDNRIAVYNRQFEDFAISNELLENMYLTRGKDGQQHAGIRSGVKGARWCYGGGPVTRSADS
ncbi:DUF3800 domain-containing protein [Alienimonas sp. DA493]|uniref:DUF3800 domain-containing protein n=1 Tax=Alienimonas sp. DA493 TaxID=3373605 RepID=UPI0037543AA5